MQEIIRGDKKYIIRKNSNGNYDYEYYEYSKYAKRWVPIAKGEVILQKRLLN